MGKLPSHDQISLYYVLRITGEILWSAKQFEGSLILGVADTGSGISPDILPHIFERLYRDDSSRNGGWQ
jgi:signal transduction histidine kinase